MNDAMAEEFARCGGEFIGEPDAQVGMHEAVERFGRFPAHYPAQQTVAMVGWGEAVAVDDIEVFAGDDCLKWLAEDSQSDLGAQKPADVPIVVAA